MLQVNQPPAAAKLIGYWDFGNIADNTVCDLSGKGHHGIIHGSPELVEGASGRALRFKNNEDYVDFRRPLIPEKDFLISILLNCDDVRKQFFLGQYRYQHPGRLDLAIREGAVRIQTGETIVDSFRKVTARKWHRLIYYRKNNQLKIYVNARLIEDICLPTGVIQTEPLIVGRINVPGRTSFRFSGMIDRLQIYKGVFSTQEIKQISEGIV